MSRCPHLGFDPAPGDPHAVRELHRTLTRCGQTLEDTRGVVTRLMDGAVWKGDAAVAFRDRLANGPLPLDLRNAARSMRKAARHLERWEADLLDFQRRAARLNARAGDARDALDRARRRAAHAASDPDLDADGHRREQAERALRHLASAASAAAGDLDGVLAEARALASEHEAVAGRRARAIREATCRLAPHKPGAFDDLIEWTTSNLPDILSTLSAAIGLAALLLSGPVGAGVLMLAAALSASAVVTRLAMHPDVRTALWDGFTKGEFDTDFWSCAVALTGDGLAAVPGLATAGKGLQATRLALQEGAEVPTLTRAVAAFGVEAAEAKAAVQSQENPITRRWVAAGLPESVLRKVEAGATAAGFATAAVGFLSTGVDALQDDAVTDASTAVNGVPLIPLSGGDAYAIVKYLGGMT